MPKKSANSSKSKIDRRAQKPPSYWGDFANVERELLAFVAQHGIDRVMPTKHELKAAGRNDLYDAISKPLC